MLVLDLILYPSELLDKLRRRYYAGVVVVVLHLHQLAKLLF